MGKISIVATIALLLCGCSKSPSQQFEEMYQDEKKNNPEAAAAMEDAYRYRDNLTDQQKMEVVRAYENVKAARAKVEALQ